MRTRDGDFRARAVGGGFVARLIGGPSGRVRFAREFRRPRRGFLVRGTVEGGARTRVVLPRATRAVQLGIGTHHHRRRHRQRRRRGSNSRGEGRERRIRLRRARPRHVVAKRHGNGARSAASSGARGESAPSPQHAMPPPASADPSKSRGVPGVRAPYDAQLHCTASRTDATPRRSMRCTFAPHSAPAGSTQRLDASGGANGNGAGAERARRRRWTSSRRD